ncbi:MAG: thiosulfate oxidation carrier complex protein SoxZ [Pseudomonadota bacterium]|jgi:sulfur-oxidizing protein SoxZ
MRIRTLIDMPRAARIGEIITIRATIAHPMETGYRRGSDGVRLPRNIIRSFHCRIGDREIFRADLFPAVSANPYLVFHHRVRASGELVFSWRGDQGFAHEERVSLIAQ